ncbi:MAG TPA: hypothetical protein VJB59_02970 [Bdellovibrionota bacterium]|nr:hypothetical protein [Bdellovibrionota bacterium]
MRNLKSVLVLFALVGVVGLGLAMTADPCFASFESSLIGIKTKLTGVILPLLSVIGLGFAALSFLTGNPNAKQHITYAVIGASVGFGAQAIVDFIASTIH